MREDEATDEDVDDGNEAKVQVKGKVEVEKRYD